MSTVRIQVRRGLASNWTSVNPTLAGGEIGYETDTGKLKIGDGSTAWSTLSYVSSDAQAIDEISQDAVNAALSMGAGLSKTYDDAGNTITLENTGVLSFNTRTGEVTLTDTDVNTALGYTAADAADIVSLSNSTSSDISDAITTAEAYTDSSISVEVLNRNSAISTAKTESETYTDNAITYLKTHNVNFSGNINAETITASEITVDNVLNTKDVNISGDLNVSGTTTTVNSSSLSVTDPLIYLGADNQSNVLDLGFVASFNDGTYQHTGLVRDQSDNVWKLFSGVTSEPGSTVDFTNATKDSLIIRNLMADGATIGSVSNTEISYLDGVTSKIQDQIDTKADSSVVDATYAPKNNPTLTDVVINGTLSLPSGSITTSELQDSSVTTLKLDNLSVTSGKLASNSVQTAKINDSAVTSSKIADGSISNSHISSSAGIAQSKITDLVSDLELKATLADPTFTGVVTLPSTTVIGNVSSVEIGYIDGVTSSIQTQLDSKASASTTSSHISATTNVHGISDTAALATKTYADSAVATHEADTTNVHGISDTAALATKTYADGKASDAQTAATSAASTALAAHEADTTNIHGIVDTSLLVTTAGTQTLTNKTLTSPTITGTGAIAGVFTGNLTGNITGNVSGNAGTVTNGIYTTDTGTVTSTMIADGTIVNSDINASAAIAQSKIANLTTDLSAKAALSGATFTGDVTVPNIIISGNLTVSGTTTTVNATNLAISDPLIYVGTGNSANASDLGIVGHFNNGTYQHTGLIRDHADGKWKLFSNVTTEPGSATIDLTGATYDVLKVGTVEGNLTGNSTGTHTGAVVGNADTATKLATARAINGVNFDGSAAITIKASTTSALTIGTGLSGTSFDGSGAVTIAIDSTVATLTGTQTLTNKTLTSPSITTPTVSSGTLTVASAGITFSDGTVQTVAGTPSLTPINPQTASITLGSSFARDSFVKMNVASANTVTIPLDSTYSYPIGASIDFQQAGAGQTSFVATAGVTFEAASVNGTMALKTRGQFSVATAMKTAANTWAIFGDLTN